ncbi:MAG: nucleotidyltransferase family protein [Bacteroidota bacterium]
MIRSAVLLAAGRGKRQRPYTDVTPKPLLEVDGRSTLDYVLSAVRKAGVERVCIVTHHLEEKIFSYVGDGRRWNLSVIFAHQRYLLGSGDALLSVPETWIRDEPFMLAATDYVLEEDSLLELMNAWERRKAQIAMSLKQCPPEDLIKRSTVEVDGDWNILRIIEKPGRDEILSPYAASMIFILPPAIWEYMRAAAPSERGEIEVQPAVDRMIQDGSHAIGLLQRPPREWERPSIAD